MSAIEITAVREHGRSRIRVDITAPGSTHVTVAKAITPDPHVWNVFAAAIPLSDTGTATVYDYSHPRAKPFYQALAYSVDSRGAPAGWSEPVAATLTWDGKTP